MCRRETAAGPSRTGSARRSTVSRPAGHVRPFHRWPRHAARHRRGVDDPVVVEPEVGVRGQQPYRLLDQRQRGSQPLVVSGPLWHVREHRREVVAGKTQPAGLRGEAQQGLRDSQTHEFGVAQPRWPAQPSRPSDLVVDLHVQSGDEGVQVFVRHKTILDALSLRSQTPRQYLELLV